MRTEDYLALQQLSLEALDEWSLDQEGFCFVFPKTGSAHYVAGQVQHRLMPGDVLVTAGGTGGRLRVPKGSNLVFGYFCLLLENLFPLFSGHEISHLQRVAEGLKSSKFYPASSPLARQCRRLIEDVPPQFNLEHRGQLVRVTAVVLTEEFKTAYDQRTGNASAEERVVEVFERLSADQLLSLSVGELATKFGCSRRHLNRLFHQHFGFSVAALRMEMRLLKAISLLRDTNTKVIHVAEKCGFNHLGLFNTCFRRRFGVSPGAWRKQTTQREKQFASAHGESSPCPLISKGLCPMAGTPEHIVSSAPKASPLQKFDESKVLPGALPKNPPGSSSANTGQSSCFP